MHDYRDEVNRKARETLARLQAAERKREFERGPVDTQIGSARPICDWRGCRTVTEMTTRQFDQWCRDGKPALKAPVATVPKAKVDDIVRAAIDQERASTQAALETLASIIGEECGKNEKALRTELDALRTELHALRSERSAEAIDLPDWKSYAAH